MPPFRNQRLFLIYLVLPVVEGIGLSLLQPTYILKSLQSPLGYLIATSLLLFTSILGSFTWVAWTAWRKPVKAEQWIQQIRAWVERYPIYWSVLALAGLGSAGCFYLTPLAFQIYPAGGDYCILHLLFPLVPWLAIFFFQTLIVLRILRHGSDLSFLRSAEAILRVWIVVAVLTLVIILGIHWSGILNRPDTVDMGVPGVPVLASQIILGLGLALGGLAVGKVVGWIWGKRELQRSARWSRGVDVFFFLLFWGGAVGLWIAQPIKATWFNPPPRLPNQEFYPYSDSINYDFSAQRLLIGSGFEAEVIRPMYSGFLALAQSVSGINYVQVVDWQVVVLALIPPLLYLLGKTLHTRLSGLVVGILAILRESNALALMGQVDVSTSKMYMSDLPAQLGIILFAVFVTGWLKDPARKRLYPLLAGGTLGVFILVRTQITLVLPIFPLLAWLAYRKQPGRYLQSSLLLIIGLGASLLPWTIRNWTTHRSFISDPEPGRMILRFIDFAPEAAVRLPNETNEDYVLRASQAIRSAMLAQPLAVFQVVGSHYVNNQIAALLVPPLAYPVPVISGGTEATACSGLFWLAFRDELFSVIHHADRAPYWTGRWDLIFPVEAWAPLLASFGLITLGIAAGWSRSKTASLVPILSIIFYNMANAGVRLSGWRFSLPVDWVGLLFYAIGLVQLLIWMGEFFGYSYGGQGAAMPAVQGALAQPQPGHFPYRRAFICSAFFIVLVSLLPLAERVIPNRYNGITVPGVLDQLSTAGRLSEAGIQRQVIDTFLEEPQAIAYIGRALYPRYYWANQGQESTKWPAYMVRDFSRIGFILAPQKADVVLPFHNELLYFPNAWDVLVIGCERDDYVEAFLLVGLEEQSLQVLTAPQPHWTCQAQ